MLARMRRILWQAAALASAVSLLGTTAAMAAAGDPDPAFGGGDGMATFDAAGGWTDAIFGVGLQSDGRIVVAGSRYDPAHPGASTRDFEVARFDTSGAADVTFDTDAWITTNFGAADTAWDVAIQPDDKIVAAGEACSGSKCDVAVARYNPKGGLDTSFSGDGKKLVDFGGGKNGGRGVVIQPDGKIVVAGYMVNASGDEDFAVYRLKPNGGLDTTFSGDGRMRFGFGAGRQDRALDVVLQGSKIVVAGYTCNALGRKCDFAIARVKSNGALDTTFSGDGRQRTEFGDEDVAFAVAVQADNKIVAAGYRHSRSTGSYECAVARYGTGGGLDSAFDSDGRVLVDPGSDGWCNDVRVQTDDKIVLAGAGYNGSDYDFAVIRLNGDGSPDATFSTDGQTLASFSADDDLGESLVFDGSGNYVVAGRAGDSSAADIGVLRMLP